jgi:hypothetical protein
MSKAGAGARSRNRVQAGGDRSAGTAGSHNSTNPCAQPLIQLACFPPQHVCLGPNFPPCPQVQGVQLWAPCYTACTPCSSGGGMQTAKSRTELHRQCQVMHPRAQLAAQCCALHQQGLSAMASHGWVCSEKGLSLPPQWCKGLSADTAFNTQACAGVSGHHIKARSTA